MEQNYIKENNIVDLQKRKKHQVLEELQDIMKLNTFPHRIEAFDISNK